MKPSPVDASAPKLGEAERAEIRRTASESLARQSAAGVYGHWVLAAVVLSTGSVARAYPAIALAAGAWVFLVGCGRLAVARSFARLWDARPELWTALFRGGLIASSATWGLGGTALLIGSEFDLQSRLVLLSLAGIAAGAIASMAADVKLLRLHVAMLLGPLLVAGLVFMPGTNHFVVGFAVIVATYGGFLWIQAGYAHRSFYSALVKTKLLERQTVELEAARRESLDANRAKSDFLANMSHEVRTPIAAVLGYADLLLDPTIGASDRVNYVQTIRRNADHLLSVVNDILDISKIEAGKMTVERIATSPSQIVVEVASLMRVRAVEKKLGFEIEYVGSIPETIQSDPTRLKQILLNFVGNAIKFTSEGSVRIRVQSDGPDVADPRLTIDVADEGIGMTEAQIEKLFAPFVQADASTTRKFGGTGLGLVISKRLAEALGGSIQVESAPGVGSVFQLRVPTGPLAGVPMVDGRVEAGVVNKTDLAGPPAMTIPPTARVLLAEDGRDNQALITTYLAKAGAQVKVVDNGQLAVDEALAAVDAEAPYDVVLMDMQMPVLDGYSATSKLRMQGYRGPVVALTAHAMAGDRERCQSAGCDDYLSKPVDRAKLIATVARFVAGASPASGAHLVSTLANDSDLEELVRQYVRDLPERSSAILRAFQASDIETLTRLAHQLKGSAGAYGFPLITEAAAAVEAALTSGLDRDAVRVRAEELAKLCRRARAA
ncbi:MAG TPA: ATP-binding protein [Polyangiaceae bacterium]|jgi:signal transduction histidine kinase/CheY-like chemotaxis protein|nr:ATP-binding protein [Polyangiaceae bacterium]